MSDYTAPNKTDGTSTWSATEHNQMKDAINSKFDKTKVKSNLDTPSETDAPSTSLLAEFQSSVLRFRQHVNSASNLNQLTTPGYYIPDAGEEAPAWHATFPANVPEGVCLCGLLVYAKGDFINQELTLYLTRPRVFKRVCTDNPESAGWSNWVEYTTFEVAKEEFAPIIKSGVPSVSLDGAPGYSISVDSKTKDMGGKITLSNVAANPQPFITFFISFEKPQPDIVSVSIVQANDEAANGSIQITDVSQSGFRGKTASQLNVGQSASFYFSTILNS